MIKSTPDRNFNEKICLCIKKLMKICNNRDLSSYLDMLHDDFTVVFHKSGNSLSKEEWSSMVVGMFGNEKFVFESSRCVYENSEMMVDHSFMSYPDATRRLLRWSRCLKTEKYYIWKQAPHH